MYTSTLSTPRQRRLDFNLLVGLPQMLLSCGTATVGTLFIFWITRHYAKPSAENCYSAVAWLWTAASFTLIVVRNMIYAKLKRVQPGSDSTYSAMTVTPVPNTFVQGQEVNFGKAVPLRAAAAIASGLIWGAAALLFFNEVNDEGQHFLLLAMVTLTFTSMPSLYASRWGYLAIWAPAWLPNILIHSSGSHANVFIVSAVVTLMAGCTVSKGIRMALKQMMQRHSKWIDEVIASRERAIETEAKAQATKEMAYQHKMFLLGAGHDLAQPINTMLNCLGSFEKRIEDMERFGGPLNLMRTAAASLQRLCTDIIHMEKVNSGLHKAELKPVSLQVMFEKIINQTLHLSKAKLLTLSNRATNAVVRTDPFYLERILRNLVENAIRYTPSEGNVMLVARSAGEFVNIEVWNSGPGISPETQQRMFEAFERGDNPGPQKGFGLGLSIVKGLATSIGGTITVKSIPGKGTRFRVALPKTDLGSSDLDTVDTTGVLPSINGMWVALIDDNDNLRHSLVDYLQGEGANVLAAKDAASMVPLLKDCNERMDVLITDWNLRGATGEDAFRTLLKEVPGFYPMWIVISAAIHPEKAGEIQARGVPVLIKPVEPTILRDEIARRRLLSMNPEQP
jgi:signal transduction histidine kinase/CheY-like chemotaxis protein